MDFSKIQPKGFVRTDIILDLICLGKCCFSVIMTYSWFPNILCLSKLYSYSIVLVLFLFFLHNSQEIQYNIEILWKLFEE